MKAIVVMVACAAISGCGVLPQGSEGSKLSDLSSQVNDLSQQIATKDAEISALALRVSELEAKRVEEASAEAEQASLIARLAAIQPAEPEVGAPWVAWFKETPINPQFLMGYKPDTPLGAFATREQCIDAIRKAVVSNNGNPDQGSYIADMGRYKQRNSYACLPNGTDPRIKR